MFKAMMRDFGWPIQLDLQTSADTFASSADPNETSHH